MNRKRKFNELYKGVFKNDKKSCLVDLKPLDKKVENEMKKRDKDEGAEIAESKKIDRAGKKIRQGVNLRVKKDLGFGTFFPRLRDEIVEIFLAREDFISYEGLINSTQVIDLFKFKDSSTKSFLDKELINLDNTSKQNFLAKNQSYYNLANNTTEIVDKNSDINIEEIIYEDENETIYKKRKAVNNTSGKLSENKINFFYEEGERTENRFLLRQVDPTFKSNIFMPHRTFNESKSLLDTEDDYNYMRMRQYRRQVPQEALQNYTRPPLSNITNNYDEEY